ncbi:MAG: AEC family transporter [bacterium]|nr:AEC family transporter [bacterium]
MAALLNTLLNVITPILLIVALGALYGRVFQPDPRPLSSIVIYLFSPFLVLESLANAELSTEMGRLMLLVVLLSFVMALIGLLTAGGLGLERRLASGFTLAVVLINGGNYGIPFSEFAFGETARPYAVVYYVISALMTNLLGVYIASRGSVSAREAVINIFKVPLMYGTIIGLGLNLTNTPLPLPIARTVGLLADATIPAMLVVLGLQLSRAHIRGQLRLISTATAARLVISPIVAVVLVALLSLNGVAAQVAISSSAMPTAVIASIIATQFNSDSEFVTSVIVFSTLCSVLTLSVLVTLLT